MFSLSDESCLSLDSPVYTLLLIKPEYFLGHPVLCGFKHVCALSWPYASMNIEPSKQKDNTKLYENPVVKDF